MDFLILILVGVAAGWLAGQFMKGSSFGILGNLIVGIIGALVGGFLFRLLGFYTTGGLLSSLAVATLGAVTFLYLLRLVKK